MEETQHVNTTTFNQPIMTDGEETKSASDVSSQESEGSKPAPETIAPKGYLPFVEARKFAVSLNLKTRKEWRSYVKGDIPNTPPKPANVPAHPDGIYKVKGWQGWKYWLGTADVGLNQANKAQAQH